MAPVNIGYTAGIETTKVAHQWIEKGNQMDRIIGKEANDRTRAKSPGAESTATVPAAMIVGEVVTFTTPMLPSTAVILCLIVVSYMC